MGLLNYHANQRYHERVGVDISKSTIINALKNKQTQNFERVTASRSKVYILLNNNEVVKAVINRKSLELITFLPWQAEYKIEYKLFHQQYGEFRIWLYPDCYMETKKKNVLTKVFLGNDKEPITPLNYRFEELFNLAWEYYEKTEAENKKATA